MQGLMTRDESLWFQEVLAFVGLFSGDEVT
jgi:hypothetical protein